MKLSVFSIFPIATVGVSIIGIVSWRTTSSHTTTAGEASIITLQSKPANALRQQVYRRGAIAAEDDQRALEDLSMSIQDVELNVAPQFNAALGGV